MYLRKNQGVMDTLDLGEAHQSCSSSEECSQWVKALHSAMARKDSGLRRSTFFVDETIENETENIKYESIYASIPGDNANQGNETIRASGYKVSDYTTPVIPIIYEVVSSTPQVTTEHESELYNDAYSQINKVNSSQNDKNVELRNSKNIYCINLNGAGLDNTNTDIYDDARSESNKGPAIPISMNSSVESNSESSSREHNNPETETDGPFNLLVAALTIDESPLPAFNHPLTEEDRVPVKELTEFWRAIMPSAMSLIHQLQTMRTQ
ncbi:hypothetical protein Btru_035987 [Bulinus truncatus]|nr:hypothetical protein Btru_035987 [Bulinus truncatus]